MAWYERYEKTWITDPDGDTCDKDWWAMHTDMDDEKDAIQATLLDEFAYAWGNPNETVEDVTEAAEKWGGPYTMWGLVKGEWEYVLSVYIPPKEFVRAWREVNNR